MISVKARPGEPAAVLMKRFKKACETAKLKDAMKRAAYYEKAQRQAAPQKRAAGSPGECGADLNLIHRCVWSARGRRPVGHAAKR